MHFFISGTDTNIGKTIVASWICLHTGYDYFKPIQSGDLDSSDSIIVKNLARTKVHHESYRFSNPLSPHIAARNDNVDIKIDAIKVPSSSNLVIEGAGGLLVPINSQQLMVDLIKKTQAAVILVASTKLGTINHTLLSIEALRNRNIEIAGVILSGSKNQDNQEAIEYYGNICVLGHLPLLKEVNYSSLSNIELTHKMKKLFQIKI